MASRLKKAGGCLALGAVAMALPMALAASPASAADSDVRITEVAPWASSSPLGYDWFELTNTGGSAVNVTNWRMDDSSNAFGTAHAITGVTSLPPGGSAIIFVEVPAPGTLVADFSTVWFGGAAPASVQFGFIQGASLGIGLSSSGDGVSIFTGAGTPVTSVTFGAADSTPPLQTFDNAAGVNGAIATLSAVGVNGAFTAPGAAQVGSPGTATVGGPVPTTTSTTTTVPSSTFAPWPGSPSVQPAEAYDFGEDMSGLDYEGSGSTVPGVLWAARNKAGTLFRLVFNGTKWVPDTANGWGAGKDLLYASGTGHPDSEGLTFVGDTSAGGIYVASERNNDASGVSKNVVLRYDVSGSTATLTAAQEWDLTASLPTVGANLGLEGITWIDDSYLVARNFFDESKSHAYNPAEYPNHGTGLFFVAVEGTGNIYAYALETTGALTRIASFGADLAIVTDVQFDRDEHTLWAECDNTCNGRLTILEVNPATGKFEITSRYERPANLANNNNEGFAIAPATYCVDGFKPVYWADDGATGGDSIVSGTLPCNGAPTPVVSEFPQQVLPFLTAGGLAAAAWFLNRRRSLRLA